jgi:hypothetical protein
MKDVNGEEVNLDDIMGKEEAALYRKYKQDAQEHPEQEDALYKQYLKDVEKVEQDRYLAKKAKKKAAKKATSNTPMSLGTLDDLFKTCDDYEKSNPPKVLKTLAQILEAVNCDDECIPESSDPDFEDLILDIYQLGFETGYKSKK